MLFKKFFRRTFLTVSSAFVFFYIFFVRAFFVR